MTTPAGWYPDPESEGQQRYWNGTQWTDHRAPATTAATPSDPASSDATAPFGAVTADPAPPAAGSRRNKLFGGVAAGVLVVAAGAFAVTQLAGADGGFDSPEAAVESLFEAVGQEDLVGVAETVLPGERRTFLDPALEGIGHLQRWGVLDESFDDRDVAGIDLEVDGLQLRAEPADDDIVNIYASGRISAEIDGNAIPLGDLLSEQIPPDQDLSELDVPRESADFDDVMITAVRDDGRWYVSGTYTLAETARAEAGVAMPTAGVTPVGADSPEAAVDGMIAAINDLDLEAVLARWNPDEAGAVQRYAPLFIGEGQAELDAAVAESDVEIAIEDVEYDIVRRDGLAIVQFRGATISGSGDGESFSVTIDADGCITATAGGDTEELCTDTGAIDLTDTPMGNLEEMFADMDDVGLVVAQSGGKWYVSPMRSYSEGVLAFMRVIDREHIDRFIEVIEDGSLERWFETELSSMLEESFGLESGELIDELEDQLEGSGAVGGLDSPAQGAGSGTTTETTMTPTTADDESAGTHGTDPVLDALWDGCEAGDAEACVDLFWDSPIDSEYEEFAMTCGGRREPASVSSCAALIDAG